MTSRIKIYRGMALAYSNCVTYFVSSYNRRIAREQKNKEGRKEYYSAKPFHGAKVYNIEASPLF